MRKVFCDVCSEELEENNEDSSMITIFIEQVNQHLSDIEGHFCSQKCCGKWMIEKAKGFGVYDK